MSDNGPSFIAKELAGHFNRRGISHTRGKPYHPMTQGKVERWPRSLKNVVKLEHYYLPGALEASIGRFVDYYNHQRVLEAPDNLTPADVYHGRTALIRSAREQLEQRMLKERRRYSRGLKVKSAAPIVPQR